MTRREDQKYIFNFVWPYSSYNRPIVILASQVQSVAQVFYISLTDVVINQLASSSYQPVVLC